MLSLFIPHVTLPLDRHAFSSDDSDEEDDDDDNEESQLQVEFFSFKTMYHLVSDLNKAIYTYDQYLSMSLDVTLIDG